MNIFILDLNVILCAIMHCDKHCVKMILETAQMLCTSHIVLDGEIEYNEKGKKIYKTPNPNFYKATHINHPCNVWLRKSDKNYQWLYKLFIALCDEYTYRYEKTHLCDKKFRDMLKIQPKNIIHSENMTPFALAMPNYCKIHNKDGDYDVIQSYRNYYKLEKSHIGTWKKREKPKWFN